MGSVVRKSEGGKATEQDLCMLCEPRSSSSWLVRMLVCGRRRLGPGLCMSSRGYCN